LFLFELLCSILYFYSKKSIGYFIVETAFGGYLGIEPGNDGGMTVVAVEYGVDLELSDN
jgi:hypothetical protein